MITDYSCSVQKNGDGRDERELIDLKADYPDRISDHISDQLKDAHDGKSANGETRRRLFRHKGRYGFMQYINGLIGCAFILFSLIHVPHPTPFSWAPYALAAVLAFITLRGEISEAFSRVLAISTTVLMFFFFAGFFVVAPRLAADWYMHQAGWAAVCLILGAFGMIPILSDYSCRLKAECREARAAERKSFFSVPNHIHPKG